MAEKGRPYILDGGGCHLLAPPWSLDPDVADKAVRLATYAQVELGEKIRIISGHRTCQEQTDLYNAGRGARPGYSAHEAYPALAFDIAWDKEPGPETRYQLAAFAKCIGLRAGIYFTTPDPNHFDTSDGKTKYRDCP